ncbi:hypothetical protein ACFPRL_23585 [Pseudoclavibacter helvolus]
MAASESRSGLNAASPEDTDMGVSMKRPEKVALRNFCELKRKSSPNQTSRFSGMLT